MSKKPSLSSLREKKNNDNMISSNQDSMISNNQNVKGKEKKKTRDAQQLIRMYPDAKKQLKALSVELDTSVTDLVNQAINHIFEQNKKPPIA